jgi:hypothetical protein
MKTCWKPVLKLEKNLKNIYEMEKKNENISNCDSPEHRRIPRE